MTAPAAAQAAPSASPGDQASPAATPGAQAAPAAPVQAAGAPVPTVNAPGQAPGTENLSDVEKVEKLPQWAQKLIRDARDGAADSRTKAQEAEAKTKAILKAAGIETDEADPAKIAAELETERSTSRQRAVELAVFRAASSAGADPDALLDSRGFLDKVKDLDPSDTQGIRLAIADAIQANPRLAAKVAEPPAPPAPPAPAAGVSGADFAGGTGAAAQQLTREQLAGMSPADILKAHKEGRLASLTGAK